MKKLRSNLEYCPHCNANLQSIEIPERDRESFGATHFSRKIGLYNLETDRTDEWMCPDCGGKWSR